MAEVLEQTTDAGQGAVSKAAMAISTHAAEVGKPPPVTAAQLRFEVSRLHQQVRELSNVVRMHGKRNSVSVGRSKIDASMMVADDSTDNPYGKFMRYEANGVPVRPSRLRRKGVVVIGLGGVGATVAECLVRAGVERIVALDRGAVQLCHLGSLFYRAEALGWSKARCVEHVLRPLNPDVGVVGVVADVCTEEGRASLNAAAFGRPGRKRQRSPALVLCCVDSVAARLAVCKWCLESGIACIDAAVSHTAFRGSVRFVSGERSSGGGASASPAMPPQAKGTVIAGRHHRGSTKRGQPPACLRCRANAHLEREWATDEAAVLGDSVGDACGSSEVAEEAQGTDSAETFCSAHLPSTDGVVAGIVVQQALKFLLAPHCPPAPHVVTYDATSDDFHVTQQTDRDPECAWCAAVEGDDHLDA